jgi:hypothetical protein
MPVLNMEEWRKAHCSHCFHLEDDPACQHWRRRRVLVCCKCGVKKADFL